MKSYVSSKGSFKKIVIFVYSTIVHSSIKTHGDHVERELSNPVPLPDRYFDSFSFPLASIVFGDMAIVLLFLLLLFFFFANSRSCLEGYRLAQRITCAGHSKLFFITLFCHEQTRPKLNTLGLRKRHLTSYNCGVLLFSCSLSSHWYSFERHGRANVTQRTYLL